MISELDKDPKGVGDGDYNEQQLEKTEVFSNLFETMMTRE
jgi:hypothetical protein